MDKHVEEIVNSTQHVDDALDMIMKKIKEDLLREKDKDKPPAKKIGRGFQTIDKPKEGYGKV